MDSIKIKSDVLQKLIDMMDEKMVGDLKGKNPKFAKPEEVLPEEIPQDDKFPMEEQPEEEMAAPESQEDEADMQRLLEMYKNIK